MKKGAWAAGVVAVVVAAGGGWLAVHTLETKTERAVRDMLADMSATAESVDYSFLGNTLRLDGVHYQMELDGQRSATSVESLTLAGFDRACLDPEAGPELPRVADSLVAAGLGISGSGEVVTRGSIAEVRVEGWYQNLGKLAALYSQEPWSEAFFAETYRYRLDMMAYKDYRVSVQVPDQKPVSLSLALFGLLGPAGSRDAGGEAGRTISAFFNDFTADMPGYGSAGVKRVEMHDLLLPPPAAMSRLMTLAMESRTARAQSMEAMREAGEKMWKEMAAAYRGTTPYTEIVFQAYEFRPEREGTVPPLLVDEVRNRLSLADPFVFGLDVIGFHHSWSEVPAGWRLVGSAFQPDGFLADGSVQLSLRADRQPSGVEWSAGLRDLGRVEGKNILELNVADLDDVVKLASNQLKERVFLKEADAVYTDHGLAALALAATAQSQGIAVEALQHTLENELPTLGREAGELGPMLEKAAGVMLDKPGVLSVRCRPARPLPLPQAFMALLIQPQILNLTVSAEPGDKPLLDWIPAGLKQRIPEAGAAAVRPDGPDDRPVSEEPGSAGSGDKGGDSKN